MFNDYVIVRKNTVTGGQDLWRYRNGYLLESMCIDRTFFGRDWNKRHGMAVTEIVTADNGERFEIWKKAHEMICAIPV